MTPYLHYRRAWLDRHLNLHEIKDARDHLKWADDHNLIPKRGSIDFQKGYLDMFSLGWVRIILDREIGVLTAEGKPTDSQLRFLKQLAEGNDLKLKVDRHRFVQLQSESEISCRADALLKQLLA